MNNYWYLDQRKIDNNNIISFINDITESKLYTEQIKKKEALIDPIINSTDDIIFSTDNKFKITTFNNSFKDKIKLLYNKDIKILNRDGVYRLKTILKDCRLLLIDSITNDEIIIDNGDSVRYFLSW